MRGVGWTCLPSRNSGTSNWAATLDNRFIRSTVLVDGLVMSDYSNMLTWVSPVLVCYAVLRIVYGALPARSWWYVSLAASFAVPSTLRLTFYPIYLLPFEERET